MSNWSPGTLFSFTATRCIDRLRINRRIRAGPSFAVRGESLTSEEMADRLRRWQAAGRSTVVFLIGGADGLADSLRNRAELRLGFGKATWPHQLVRIMLLEQIYRAVTILSGHPYHRE
jgi:23S rRNA (pseudouridine1915-N3)-methyltransferase